MPLGLRFVCIILVVTNGRREVSLFLSLSAQSPFVVNPPGTPLSLSLSLSLSPSFVPRGLTKVLLGGYLEAPFYPRPGRFTLPRIKISARPRREILPTVSPLEARTGIVCTRRNGRAGTRGYTHRNGRLRLACMIRRVRARAKRRRSMNVPHYSLPEDVPRGN